MRIGRKWRLWVTVLKIHQQAYWKARGSGEEERSLQRDKLRD